MQNPELARAMLKGGVRMLDDGRIDIHTGQNESPSGAGFGALEPIGFDASLEGKQSTDTVPSSSPSADHPAPVHLSIVIQVVGSRGDIQPFVALGKELSSVHNHRVRLATHARFRDFVEDAGLEFFDIGGDPEELMAFMVKNPGLFPNIKTIRSGAIQKRRHEMKEIIHGCWRSCFESGNALPFVADAIIANPPSLAHVHCAQRLGIPVHLMFTMPWSPTRSFPHPLAVIHPENCKETVANFYSYTAVDALIWEGLGDLINKFRRKTLVLDPLDRITGPNLLNQLHLPYAYLWSPSLLSKPKDWGQNIDVCGFCFLPPDDSYVPPKELMEFINAGPSPIYIGFGSIVINDPSALTNIVFQAVKQTGQRALVSKGWGKLGNDMKIPENIMLVDNLPHDWLFAHVSCIVHHGGAGTTAAGLALGCPTVIVSFFGDQQFWGRLVAHVGAGPPAIQYNNLSVENLRDALNIALRPEIKENAHVIQQKIAEESGSSKAVQSFHRNLDFDSLSCALCPSRAASWYVNELNVGISAFAATVLVTEGLLDLQNVDLYRSMEYDTYRDPCGPLTATAHIVFGALNDISASLAILPTVIASKFSAARAAINNEHTHMDPRDECTHLYSSPDTVENHRDTECLAVPPKFPLNDGTNDKNIRLPKGKMTTPRVRQIVSESRIHGSRGLKRLYNIVIWLPTDISLTFTKALHNFPNRYNDPMVRLTPEITGVRSGLRAAKVEFTEQFYDGITGLVVQPRVAFKQGGWKGMMKGVGKGLGGAVIKPLAGTCSLIGFPLTGQRRHILKSLGKPKEYCITRSVIAKGQVELHLSAEDERNMIIQKWNSLQEAK